jgi:hypothetical protein
MLILHKKKHVHQHTKDGNHRHNNQHTKNLQAGQKD